jgi:DNA-binding response OmpR family regulator
MPYVLVIDDDSDFASAAATVLRSTGYEVEVSLDIPTAEKELASRRPDLVILDVMFPEDSSAGFSLARKIRSSKGESADVPILMLTAVNRKFPLGFGATDIDEEWLPVTDFLEKPVDLDVLAERVSAVIAKGAQG